MVPGMLRVIAALILIAIPLSARAQCGAAVYVDGFAIDGPPSPFPKDGTPDRLWTVFQIETGNVPKSEYRGIVEFRNGGPCRFDAATLKLTKAACPGVCELAIEIYGYVGDGTITTSDFNAGTRIASIAYVGEPVLSIDVTEFVRQNAGAEYLGFALRAPNPTGPFVSFHAIESPPAPVLQVDRAEPIPVIGPGVLVLLAASLVVAGALRLKT